MALGWAVATALALTLMLTSADKYLIAWSLVATIISAFSCGLTLRQSWDAWWSV